MRILQQKLRKLVIVKNCKSAQVPISRLFTEKKNKPTHENSKKIVKKHVFLITFSYHNLLIISVGLFSGGYRDRTDHL